MKNSDFISNWDSTLNQIQKVLESKSVGFANKANIALDLLEVSLSALVEFGMLTKLAVQVGASTTDGKHIVRKYSLGKKEVEDEDGYMEEVPCLKQSRIEEDE